MRLLASLSDAREARARGLSGLGDAVSDLQAQIDATNQSIKDTYAHLAWLQDQYANHGHFGGKSGSDMQAYYDQDNTKIASLNVTLNTLTQKLSDAKNTATTTAATVAAVAAASPAAQAQAVRDSVAAQQSLVEVAMGAKYDYGRNSGKRSAFYSSGGLADAPAAAPAAQPPDISRYLIPQTDSDRSIPNWELTGVKVHLGGNMQRVLDLNRPSLGFDILGAIEKGAQAGYSKYTSTPSAPSSGGPSLSIPNPLAGILPDWLTKAQLPASVRDIGGGIINSVESSASAPSAPAAPANPNAVVATTVKKPIAAKPAASTNWLIWGGLAVVGGVVLWKVVK